MAKRSEPRREVRDESAVCGAARQGVATTANKTPLVPRTSELEWMRCVKQESEVADVRRATAEGIGSEACQIQTFLDNLRTNI